MSGAERNLLSLRERHQLLQQHITAAEKANQQTSPFAAKPQLVAYSKAKSPKRRLQLRKRENARRRVT